MKTPCLNYCLEWRAALGPECLGWAKKLVLSTLLALPATALLAQELAPLPPTDADLGVELGIDLGGGVPAAPPAPSDPPAAPDAAGPAGPGASTDPGLPADSRVPAGPSLPTDPSLPKEPSLPTEPGLSAGALAPTVELPAGAAGAGTQNLQEAMNRKGDITLRDATLGDWLFAIQEEWKINIVFSNDIRDEIVNGAFKDLTLREVLNAILLTRGYGYQPVGNSLLVIPADQMGMMRPQFEDAIIPLERLSPADVEPSVRILLSQDGQVQMIPSSKSLYIVDLPDRIDKVRRHLQVLEENARSAAQRQSQSQANAGLPGGSQEIGISGDSGGPEIETEVVEVFPIRFAELTAIEDAVQQVIGPEGRTSSLQAENKLVVIAPANAIRAASQVIERLDVARPQVRITALLYDVRVEDMGRLGFNWSNLGKGRFASDGTAQSLVALDSTNFTTATTSTAAAADAATEAATTVTNPIGGFLKLSYLSQHFDLNTVIQAFSELEGARLLARPNVIAYDGMPAEFRSVSEIPVQQLTQTDAGGNIGTTIFREAGITLIVTPRINSDGSLRLDIAPEFSVLAGFSQGQPIIDRRSASTTVQMQDGQTVVIGGLLRRNELETQTGVPGLKNMKYLGVLFRDHETTVGDSELIVFVQTEIIQPTHYLKPREEMAAATLHEAVDSMPMASSAPVIAPCRDPYCPLHHPHTHNMRPFVQHHSTYQPGWSGEFYEESYDTKPQEALNQAAQPPVPPSDLQPMYPAVENSVLPQSGPFPGDSAPQVTPGATQNPPQRTQSPLVPGIRTDGAAPSVGGPSVETPSAGAADFEPSVEVGPPPVIIDETARARRRRSQQFVIRRLPHISNETSQRELAPASAETPISQPNAYQAQRPLRMQSLPSVRSERTGNRTVEPTPPPRKSSMHWLNKFIR